MSISLLEPTGIIPEHLLILLTSLSSKHAGNESLAYIGFTKGVHRFIDHRNMALPGRFQSYQLDLEMGRGLWSTGEDLLFILIFFSSVNLFEILTFLFG